MLSHGSLFAGIGGFDLGFERAGIETDWQVEVEPYCRKVLARHFPGARQYADIKNCCGIYKPNERRMRSGKTRHRCRRTHHLKWVDIISGGFPCQDISNAGKRAGIEGDRSGLWSEMFRIVCELRPRYVVVENVSALLGRGMGRVLGDLAESGYDAEWDCLPAAAFGAPHIRDRVWIMAYANGNRRHSGSEGEEGHSGKTRDSTSPLRQSRLRTTRTTDVADSSEQAGWRICDGRREQLPQGSKEARHVADSEGRRERPIPARQRSEGEGTSNTDGRSEGLADANGGQIFEASVSRSERNSWTVEPDVGRVAHGVPSRVDRLRGLGNAVVPQIAEWIGRKILAPDSAGWRK